MKISPFKALRPTPENVGRVASVPYDTVDQAEAIALAEGNPDSFLHVVRPEIDLPAGTDVHADDVYATAARNLADFQARGVLVREPEPCCYVYRQIMGGHTQVGIVACCHVDEYEKGTILKHEKTRADKEDDRTRHVLTLEAHTGPVFLTYRDQPEIDAQVSGIMDTDPLFDTVAPDGVQHTVWRVPGGGSLVQDFTAVPKSYIADGHHRSAAAHRAGMELRGKNPQHDGTEEYNWFLTVLFPASQLKILPYNRVVDDLNGRDAEAFLAAVRERFDVREGATPAPQHPRSVSMYLAGKWYEVSWPEPEAGDPVSRLDVSVLQDRLLAPLLGIDDPRTSQRIAFIGGIRGTAALETRVDSGSGAVAFSVYPVSVDEMMDIADADQIMPPKSTWFEPKLRSGLLVHTL